MLGCPLQGKPDSGRGQLEKEAELGTESFLLNPGRERGIPWLCRDLPDPGQGWERVWKPR